MPIVVMVVVISIVVHAPAIAQPHINHRDISCLGLSIEPAEAEYRDDDTIAIVVWNLCPDTIFVTPGLAARCHDGWRDVIDDLASMGDSEMMDNGWAIFWDVAPGSTYRLRVVPRDFIAYGGKEQRFQIFVHVARHIDGIGSALDPAGTLAGAPFTVAPGSREEDIAVETNRRPDTVYSVYDPIINAPIILDGIFDIHPRRLIVVDPFDTVEVPRKTRITICWPAPLDDGDRCLTITRRQIWLTSTHNNPNPNYFYWFTNITDEQYRMIERWINGKARLFTEYTWSSGFSRTLYYRRYIPEDSLPDDWSQEVLERYRAAADDVHYANTVKLLEMINRGMPTGKRIAIPGRGAFGAVKPIRMESTLDGCGC